MRMFAISASALMEYVWEKVSYLTFEVSQGQDIFKKLIKYFWDRYFEKFDTEIHDRLSNCLSNYYSWFSFKHFRNSKISTLTCADNRAQFFNRSLMKSYMSPRAWSNFVKFDLYPFWVSSVIQQNFRWILPYLVEQRTYSNNEAGMYGTRTRYKSDFKVFELPRAPAKWERRDRRKKRENGEKQTKERERERDRERSERINWWFPEKIKFWKVLFL